MNKEQVLKAIGQPDEAVMMPVQTTAKESFPEPRYYELLSLACATNRNLSAANENIRKARTIRGVPESTIKNTEEPLGLAVSFQDFALQYAEANEPLTALDALDKAEYLIENSKKEKVEYKTISIDIPKASTETVETWFYYGKKADGYKNFAIEFDKRGFYKSRKNIGHNYAQQQTDILDKQMRIQAAGALLNYQQMQQNNYYQQQRNKTLQNMNWNLQGINNSLNQMNMR